MTLNQFYLDHITPPESRHMIQMHTPINGGRIDTLCNVTAASMAWLLTGKDLVPPFSYAWMHASKEGTGPEGVDRIIAYGPDADSCKENIEVCFDESHVLLMLHRGGKTLVIDSHWAERRMLSVREVQEAPHPAVGEQARYILLWI
jgi:hypothetical protein